MKVTGNLSKITREITRECLCSHFSHVRLFVIQWTVARQTPLSRDSSGKNTGVGSHFLLQGRFPTQGLNSSLQHCRRIPFCFLLYNIVLVSPYIKMNPPWVYTCSPSWTPLPPPSPYHPSGSSQFTSPKHPVSCIKLGLAISFLYDAGGFFTIWAIRKAPSKITLMVK